MDPRTPTEELKHPSGSMPAEDATVILPRQGAEPLRATSATGGQHCASCGAVLTPDQRYCVECGQRRGPTRPPFAGAPGQPPQPNAPAAPGRRGPRFSANTALIAGIGTLMLAMATGVLIGRTSAPSSKNAPIQYVAAPTTTTPSGTTGTGATTPSTTEEGGSPTKSSGTTGGKGGSVGKSAPSSASKLLGGKAPSKPVVKVGSSGKGPGYQKGKFTGKFFGGSSSKKQEEEEELGEEGGEEESSSSGKGKK
jgi:hypothetical protein